MDVRTRGRGISPGPEFGLLFPGFLPRGVFGHPGAWGVAAVHWLLGAAAILFLIVHLYLGTMGDRVLDLYAGMIDGFHRHRKTNRKTK